MGCSTRKIDSQVFPPTDSLPFDQLVYRRGTRGTPIQLCQLVLSNQLFDEARSLLRRCAYALLRRAPMYWWFDCSDRLVVVVVVVSSFCLSLDVVDGGGGKLLAPSSPLFLSCSLPFSPFRRCVSSLHRLAASQLLFSFRSVETCRMCTDGRARVELSVCSLPFPHTGYHH